MRVVDLIELPGGHGAGDLDTRARRHHRRCGRGARAMAIAVILRAGPVAVSDASAIGRLAISIAAIAEAGTSAVVARMEEDTLEEWDRSGEVAVLVADAPA